MNTHSGAIAEHEVVTTLSEVSAQVLGESKEVSLPAGSLGTVVLVHAVGAAPVAYEVEFHLGGLSYGLATVSAGQIVRAS